MKVVSSLTSYNQWANRRMADVISSLDPALADREVKSSFPSLRKTVMHTYGAEELWFRRLNGESPGTFISLDDPAPVSHWIRLWLEVSGRMAELPVVHPASWMEEFCSYKDLKGNAYSQPRWQMLVHCMNHSTYHRGQMVTLLRTLGMEKIPATDFIVYFREGGK